MWRLSQRFTVKSQWHSLTQNLLLLFDFSSFNYTWRVHKWASKYLHSIIQEKLRKWAFINLLVSLIVIQSKSRELLEGKKSEHLLVCCGGSCSLDDCHRRLIYWSSFDDDARLHKVSCGGSMVIRGNIFGNGLTLILLWTDKSCWRILEWLCGNDNVSSIWKLRVLLNG